MRPTCTKCSSNFVKLKEELDGYYSHCKCCGLFTLLQSKYDECLPNDVDLAEPDVDENPDKVVSYKNTFSKPSTSYFAVKALQEGPKTSGEIARYIHARLSTATWTSISGNVGATLSMLNKDYNAVEIIQYRRGVKGGSLWGLGAGVESYLSMYTLVEEKAAVEAVVKAEQRKPTLLEMLSGQKIKDQSKRIGTLCGRVYYATPPKFTRKNARPSS